MKISRVWAMPSRWTFQIPPIAELLARYVGDGKGWIDPFAGMHSPAEIRNDLNPEANAQSHLDALDFLKQLTGNYQGVLFDPPYSLRQIQECYQQNGDDKVPYRHTTNFYGDLRDAIAPLINPAGWPCLSAGTASGWAKRTALRLLKSYWCATAERTMTPSAQSNGN